MILLRRELWEFLQERHDSQMLSAANGLGELAAAERSSIRLRGGFEHAKVAHALRRALDFLRSELERLPEQRADELQGACEPAAEHVAGPAWRAAVRQHEGRVGDRHARAPGRRRRATRP